MSGRSAPQDDYAELRRAVATVQQWPNGTKLTPGEWLIYRQAWDHYRDVASPDRVAAVLADRDRKTEALRDVMLRFFPAMDSSPDDPPKRPDRLRDRIDALLDVESSPESATPAPALRAYGAGEEAGHG